MSRKAVISTAVASIHREPRFSSEIVTQALMWEIVEILEEEKLWLHILQEDGYKGWIYTFYIIESRQSFPHWITLTDRFIPVSLLRHEDTNRRMLSFGTKVPVIDENPQFITIALPGDITGKIVSHKPCLENSRSNIIVLAESLLGTPYIWGGKSAFGFDCSGFVQLILSTIGIPIARDTRMQVKTTWLSEISVVDSKPGDLLYFSENGKINHVAFSLGGGKIIHCSGEVKIESINEGDEEFNQWLSQSIINTYSVANRVTD